MSSSTDRLPDVRDGLTRVERVLLYVLHEAQKEFPGRSVPSALLYGRVVEHVNLSVPEFQWLLQRLAVDLRGPLLGINEPPSSAGDR